jgi:hypothetical protein
MTEKIKTRPISKWVARALLLFFALLLTVVFVRIFYVYYKLTSDIYLTDGRQEDLQTLTLSLSDSNIRSFLEALDLDAGIFKSFNVNSPVTKDAGPYLNRRIQVDWGVSSEHASRLKQWRKAWPEVDDRTITRVEEMDLANISEAELSHGDLAIDPRQRENSDDVLYVNFQDIDDSWLDAVQGFDHWNLDVDGPLDWETRLSYRIAARRNITDFVTLTMIKQYFRLRKQGKLSLLKRKMDHFLRLMISTEHDEMLDVIDPLAYRLNILLGGKEPIWEYIKSPLVTVKNLKTLLHPSVVQRADVIELFGHKNALICMALAGGVENLSALRRYNLSSDVYENAIQDFLHKQKSNCRFSRQKLKLYNEFPPSVCDQNMSFCRFAWVLGKPPTTLFFPVDYLISKLFDARIKKSMSESVWRSWRLVDPLLVQATP